VLVADDTDTVRRAVVRLLRDAFEIVGVASSGLEIVEDAPGLHPDVIVSDLAMPSLSGAEALKLLRDAGHTIPFVLITATDWNYRKWIDLGALAVVHKADLHLELEAAVRSASAGEVYVSRTARKS
jgi:DNA-binding NarL/FixJ family response regulator